MMRWIRYGSTGLFLLCDLDAKEAFAAKVFNIGGQWFWKLWGEPPPYHEGGRTLKATKEAAERAVMLAQLSGH